MIAIVAGHRVEKINPLPDYDPGEEACLIYTSPYYLASMKYALTHVHENRVFILSRKHGLIHSRQHLREPWDYALPAHAPKMLATFAEWAKVDALDAGILYGSQQVLALCAGPYLDVVSRVFGPHRIVAPIAGLTASAALTRLETPLPVKDLQP